MNEEVADLIEELEGVNNRIDNFFNDDDNPHYGDRGYQNLLEKRDEIQEQIDKLNKESKLDNKIKAILDNLTVDEQAELNGDRWWIVDENSKKEVTKEIKKLFEDPDNFIKND